MTWTFAVKYTREYLEESIPLHTSHWISLTEIFFLHSYHQCRDTLFNLSPNQHSTLPLVSSSDHRVSTPNSEVYSRQSIFHPFRQGDHLPSLPSIISYHPHPRSFIPVPNDPYIPIISKHIQRRNTHDRPLSPKSQNPYRSPPRSRSFHQYEIIRNSKIQVIPSGGTPPSFSLQSIPLCIVPTSKSTSRCRSASPIFHTLYNSPTSREESSNHLTMDLITTVTPTSIVPHIKKRKFSPISPSHRITYRSPSKFRTHLDSSLINLPADKIFSSKDITIGTCLGTGGFGSVYVGVIKSNKRKVAVKRLHLHPSILNPDQV